MAVLVERCSIFSWAALQSEYFATSIHPHSSRWIPGSKNNEGICSGEVPIYTSFAHFWHHCALRKALCHYWRYGRPDYVYGGAQHCFLYSKDFCANRSFGHLSHRARHFRFVSGILCASDRRGT